MPVSGPAAAWHNAQGPVYAGRVPDDVGGRPYPDGDEPDSHRGGADEEFAALVLDEDFVAAAHFREPSAVERMVGAAEARAQAEAALDEAVYDDDDPYDDHDPYGPYGGALRPYRGGTHWHRPVALLLAVVMGVGIVALVFAAVYRSSSSGRETPPPGGSAPSATTGAGVPATTGAPR